MQKRSKFLKMLSFCCIDSPNGVEVAVRGPSSRWPQNGRLERAQNSTVYAVDTSRLLLSFATTFIELSVSFTILSLWYVRPMLEYCSPVWSPVSPNLVNPVKSVQRRFTKRLPGFCSLVYNERCARLGIERLELRRLHTDLTTCFKSVHGLVALQSDNFFNIDHDHITRGHSFNSFKAE